MGNTLDTFALHVLGASMPVKITLLGLDVGFFDYGSFIETLEGFHQEQVAAQGAMRPFLCASATFKPSRGWR